MKTHDFTCPATTREGRPERAVTIFHEPTGLVSP